MKKQALVAIKLILILLLVPLSAPELEALRIILDANENDWIKPEDWSNPVCPAGEGSCQLPSQPHTVWLCCNTTSIPRECQLLWYDGPGDVSQNEPDLLYIRLYTNGSGAYLYIAVDPPSSSYGLRITMRNLGQGFTLNIIIISIRWFWSFWLPIIWSSVIWSSAGSPQISYSYGDTHIFEVAIRNVAFPQELSLSVFTSVFTRMRLTTRDYAETPTNDTAVSLQLSDSKITVGEYGYPPTPIPIPEPWVASPVVMAMLIAAIIVTRFTGKRYLFKAWGQRDRHRSTIASPSRIQGCSA